MSIFIHDNGIEIPFVPDLDRDDPDTYEPGDDDGYGIMVQV